MHIKTSCPRTSRSQDASKTQDLSIPHQNLAHQDTSRLQDFKTHPECVNTSHFKLQGSSDVCQDLTCQDLKTYFKTQDTSSLQYFKTFKHQDFERSQHFKLQATSTIQDICIKALKW
jgi:hypothetical protein